MKRVLTFSLMVCLGVAAVQAADWPQWQGPDRTRISKETGLLKEWPAGGPPRHLDGEQSRHRLRIDGGGRRPRVYLQGARGSNSFVIALNRADGKEVWSKALGPD